MSPLRALQARFVVLQGQFIAWCDANGYKLSFGESWRSPAEAQLNAQTGAGIANSLHPLRLAQDWNINKDDVELTSVEDYRPLGDYWKSLDPLCCWGGNFAKPDADHFSMTWGGVK